jgi:peptidoglycan/LPS O-acetylase OafA/YrhL
MLSRTEICIGFALLVVVIAILTSSTPSPGWKVGLAIAASLLLVALVVNALWGRDDDPHRNK